MPIRDSDALSKGSTALKNAFENIRTAIAMVHELRALGGISGQEQKTIDAALASASSNAAIAEAEIAQALGFELCKCDFPPMPMKTVGYFFSPASGHKAGDPVFECAKCGFNTAGPWHYTRTAPERAK
jgi:hypothetical protein